jgi:uncharacterized protein with NAD-binding domain and iron-sulfur cluster
MRSGGLQLSVIGGAVAGMSAAQEAAERPFGIEVYQRNTDIGGKARSVNAPNTNSQFPFQALIVQHDHSGEVSSN